MEIEIAGKKIGDGHSLFFIAEAGVNHNGSVKIGKKLIDIAVRSAADAVKFQTFKTENIITHNAPKAAYHIETTGGDDKQSWYELLKTQEMSRKMHLELMDYCTRRNIIFLSTPYDEESADLLNELNIAAYKIASTDTNNIPLLRHIAKKGRPMIISSAMATMQEVEDAVQNIRDCGLNDIAVLQCTGNYPAKLGDSNLRVINAYRRKLNCLVGYSDHTKDIINPIAATAMGANIFEKHFTLDKNLPGPDHRMSLSPEELEQTIKAIRKTEMTMGSSEKTVLRDEEENRLKLRKSVVAIKTIKEGQIIESRMLGIKRPGNGIPPAEVNSLLGKRAQCDIWSGTLIKKEMIDDQ